MTRFIAPIVFVIIAIGLFLGYVDPTYEEVQKLRAEEARFNEALNTSKALIEQRERLITTYNSFATADLERLQKLLPDNVDSVRLVLDLDNIAAKYSMRVRDVSIERSASASNDTNGASGESDGSVGPRTEPYRSIQLNFTVTGSYNDFLLFLDDLERSLRLVDVVSVEFGESALGDPDYEVSIRTYWLE